MASALDEGLCANLVPARVVSDLGAPESFFLARYGDSLLLLIKLQPAVDELERGLATTDLTAGQRVAPSVRAMAFETAVTMPDDIRATLNDAHTQSLVRSERLRWLLRNGRYYVTPLRKRTHDDTFTDRVSVGRATNKDIVLRHPNVSKLHAWFEVDEVGGIYVADAGSSNGTWLNHQRLAARELTRVDAGHHLRFGSVEAVVYGAGPLWNSVRRAQDT
jgi:hypothetical protein